MTEFGKVDKQKVLFVCLGNTCRSPLAEAVFLKLSADTGQSEKWIVDSAGIADWHVGKGPNPRTLEIMKKYHLLPYSGVSRQIKRSEFIDCDFIFAMDCWNIQDLEILADDTPGSKAKIHLIRDFDPQGSGNIPDPYCDNNMIGFEYCYEICLRSLKEFLLIKSD